MKTAVKELEQEIKKILTRGADERVFPDENGLSRYGISLLNNDIINRGSCTASPAIEEDVEYVEQLLDRLKTKEDWIKNQERNTRQLKNWLNLDGEDLFDVFYGPSGTDLFYYPIIFSKLFQPDKQIINLITCKEELGSGTPFASEGKYYANYNQFGDQIEKGERMISEEALQTIFFEARSEQGHILNHEERIKELVHSNPNKFIIINLVYGSKSGITDNVQLIDKIEADNILWSIDMCQLRHKKEIIRMFLNKKAMVMITGSKFYQAPPFCAALLVPKSISNALAKTDDANRIQKFGTVFSQYDIPSNLRENFKFPDKINISRNIRWALTMNEIGKYSDIDEEETENMIKRWNKTMMDEIKKIEEFELMPHQEKTNKSIISFRIIIDDHYLDHNQLKELHRSIVTADHQKKLGVKRLFIGQPVAYKNKSFMRIAIGAKNVRRFVKNDEHEFAKDKIVLSIIKEKLYESYGHSS